MFDDARRIVVLASGVLLAAGASYLLADPEVGADRPVCAPEPVSPTASVDRESLADPAARVARPLGRKPERVAPVPGAEALNVLGSRLARSVTYQAFGEVVGATIGRELRWRLRPRDRVLAAVRRGAAPLAVLADRPGVPAPRDLEVVELGDLVLVAVAPASLQPPTLTTAQLRRILDGHYASWRRASGPDMPVRRFGLDGLDDRCVQELFGATPASSTARVDVRSLLESVAHSEAGFGIVDLRSLEAFRPRLPVDDLSLAIDCIQPGRAAFQAGRYPFGVTLRVVAAPGAPVEARQVLGALRRLGSAHPLKARLCAP